MADKNLKIVLTAENKARKQLKGVNDQLKNIGKQALVAAGGFFTIRSALSFIKGAQREWLDYENEMKRVNTITRLSADEFKKMSREVEDLSKIVPFTAQVLSTGLFDVASAGVSAGNQMAFLGQAAKFAAAGGMEDVKTAVEGLTAVIKGFGLAEQDAILVSDLFFKTNELGQTTVQEMARSIQGVTAQAKLSGLSLTELFAVYATLTGVTGNAAEVTTQLKGALNALAAPTVEARNKFDEMGIEVGTAAIESKGFVTVLKKVFDAVDGDVEQLRKLIPEIRGGQLVAALATDQFDDFVSKLAELEDAAGSTDIAFKEMMTSQRNQLKLAENEWAFFRKRVGSETSSASLMFAQFANAMAADVEFLAKGVRDGFKAIAKIIALGVAIGVVKAKKAINSLIEAFNKLPGVNIKFRADVELSNLVVEELLNQIDGLAASLKRTGRELLDSGQQAGEFAKFTEDEERKLERLNDELNKGNSALKSNAKAADDAAEKEKELAEVVEKLGEGFSDLNKEGTRALKTLEFNHKNAMASIAKEIDNAKNKIKSLRAEFGKTERSDVKSVAEQIVSAQMKAEDIRKELAKETSADRIATLKEELAKVESGLASNAGFIASISGEIQEARRRASLTDVERAIEDFQTKRTLAEQELTQAIGNIQKEIIKLKEKEEAEKQLFQEKSDFINSLIEEATKFREEQIKTLHETTKEMVEDEIELYKDLAKAIREAQSAKASVFIPGAPSISIPATASGGIVTSPQVRLVGEAGPEAIIPLKKAGGMGSIIMNITGTFMSEDAAELMGDKIIDKLKLQTTI